ncbi:MAG: DUF4010 domain-containing protein [Bacteroidales bacterium]|nr:DUF4010 domain-containing protein [Bacteroidales bacterium]MDD4215160.1 DUF4010 domain-containing protein [Bacteroidales bacterium]
MENILNIVPKQLIDFLLVTVFSLLIGLSQRKLHPAGEDSRLFGTDRTFTFIGILGYILYIIDPEYLYLYMGGGFAIITFLGINYYFKILTYKDFGLTTIVIAFITYCIAPLVITQPAWLFILVVVTVLIFTELKETFTSFSEKIEKDEFITLAKFLIIAGIVLPIFPNKPIVPFLSITPYKIWFAVVVISSISYFSYLLKKYVFKKSGILISGILGGFYSSTAITLILARKSREGEMMKNNYAAAIILATAMMYLRIGILMLIFNMELFKHSIVYFLIMFVLTSLVGIVVYYYKHKKEEMSAITSIKDKNPLEFKVALLFMALFVAFSFITYYAVEFFGNDGLHYLSIIVGITDIDPFLISVFQGKLNMNVDLLTSITFQAIISNNVLKLCYSLVFAGKHIRLPVLISFLVVITANIFLLFFM